jgi:hypothetical protein
MEELQSDWAREGRSKGFIKPIEPPKEIKWTQRVPGEWHTEIDGRKFGMLQEKNGIYVYEDGGVLGRMTQSFEDAKQIVKDAVVKFQKGVPNNPLLKNWQELSIKRALKDAVESDAEYFAWINGEQTSARYNLATHLKDVNWRTMSGGDNVGYRQIKLTPKDASEIQFHIDKNGIIKPRAGDYGRGITGWKGKKLDEVLGKGLADSIMAKESGTLSGEGLKFGGEWADNLYDKQVGNIVSDLTGAKVEKLDLGLPISEKTGKDTWFLSRRDGVTENLVDLSVKPEMIKTLKVGDTLNRNTTDRYIITDILGDGKFKAVPKERMRLNNPDSEMDMRRFNDSKRTFDISTKKTVQQGIKLTPEIKAMIRGEAPKLK